MSLLNIRKIGDPVLRSKAKEVKEIKPSTIALIKNMIKTMKLSEGVGLAAPQVGVSSRIIVVRNQQQIISMINPEIIEQEGKELAEEGCLSIPEQRGLVLRARKIKVKGLDNKGKEKIIVAEDLLARVFQHEIDHLNGVLFTDKMIEFEEKAF